MKPLFRTLALLAVLVGSLHPLLGAETVTNLTVKLAWDPSPDDPRVSTNGFVTGYQLYWRSRSYDPAVPTNFIVGSLVTTNLSAIVSNLPGGQTYFFVVTALATNYDGSPLESDPSNEVRTNAPPHFITIAEGMTNRLNDPVPPVPYTVQSAVLNTNVLTSSDTRLLPLSGVRLSALSGSGSLSLTPTPSAFGKSTLILTATNSSATSSVAFVLTIATNKPPDVANDSYLVNEDAALTGASVLANDSDLHEGEVGENNLPLRLVQVTSTANGILTLNATTGTFTYTPNPNFFGTDTFSYRAVDSQGATSALATVIITVAPINDPPVAVVDVVTNSILGTGPVTNSVARLLANDSKGAANESSQTLTITAVTNAVGGTVALVGTNVVFTPATNYTGPLSFNYTVRDNGQSGSPATNDYKTAMAAVNFNTVALNSPPVANPDSNVVVNAFEDGGPWLIPLAKLMTNDSAGPVYESWQTLTIVAVTNVIGGTAAIVGTNLVFTPSNSFFGLASFGYTVQDNGQSGSPPTNDFKSSATTVSFPIIPVNDPPTPGADSLTAMSEDSSPRAISLVSLLANDSPGPANESAQTLTVTAVVSVAGGTAALVGTNVVFTPATNFSGAASFRYIVQDNGQSGSPATNNFRTATNTVSFTVNAVNDPPSFTKGINPTANEDAGPQTVANWATAISPGPNESTQTVSFVVTNNNPALFSVQPAIAANGTLTYTPATNAFGAATNTVILSDNGSPSLSTTQTFVITVMAVNDPPSFTKGADQTIAEDAGPQTVANWATAINRGPNESTQTVSFAVSNNNPGLFSVQPAIAANGTLTYAPATNAFGAATNTVILSDNGSPLLTATQTFVITITPVNDPPSFTKGLDQTIAEDSGPQTVANWATVINPGPNETTQTVSFAVSNNNPGLFSVPPAIAANGALTYTPATNAFGSATNTVILSDNGSPSLSATQRFVITITPVNDPPGFTKGPDQTIAEDSGPQTVANWTTAISPGPNESTQTVSFAVSNNNPGLFSVQPAIATDGTLTYTPATNAFGAATNTVVLSDNGSPVLTATQTFIITITPVNDPPSFVKGTDQTVNEDSGPQTVANWATAINQGPNESTQAVSFAVSNNNPGLFSVPPAIAANGTLTYTPATNAFGSATNTVILSDNGSPVLTATQTFVITINPVNDPPNFAKGPDQTVAEDSGPQTAPNWATAISPGPNEGTQTVNFAVTNNNPALFSVQPAIAANGTLAYTPATNAFGSATNTIVLSDSGSPSLSATQTFVLTITPVNDPPTLAPISNLATNENAGLQTVNLTGITAGPGESQTLMVTASSSNPALVPTPTVTYTSPSNTGTLTFTPVANASGSATITVVVRDDGTPVLSATQSFSVIISTNIPPEVAADSYTNAVEDTLYPGASVLANDSDLHGGLPGENNLPLRAVLVTDTINGTLTFNPNDGTFTYLPNLNFHGLDSFSYRAVDSLGETSATAVVTITVNPVNDPPNFAKGPDQTINEDAGPQTVPNWATAISAGPNESTQTVSFTVTNSNPALFSVQPVIAMDGTLTYTPATNAFGSATNTVVLSDIGSPSLSVTQTFIITTTPVNDPPGFTKGPDQTIAEDSGPQTVANWATAISAGPNENTQTVSFTVTNNNPGLFSVQPAIATDGTLTYTPATNAFGAATNTVILSDDGSPILTATQTFVITISPVNDPPSFTKGDDQTIAEDAGPQTVANWATAISPGPNETTQTVSFAVSNNNPGLFSVQPAIATDGTLTYTPATNAFGAATNTVVLSDDGSPSLSVTQMFVITVAPVNDLPALAPISNLATNEDAGLQSVSLTGITAGLGEAQNLFLTASSDNPGLIPNPTVTYTSSNGTGTLTFTPVANASGLATITVVVTDDGTPSLSATQQFTVTIHAVNDAPSFALNDTHTVNEDAGPQTVVNWATNLTAGPNEGTQTVSFAVTNNNPGLFSVQPAIDANGTLTYTPATNAFGSATNTVVLSDDGSPSLTVTQTFIITIAPVNDPPTLAPISNVTANEDDAMIAVDLSGITAGSGESQALAVTASSSNPTLLPDPTVNYTSPEAKGTLIFFPSANANGSATITVVVADDGGTTDGGIDRVTNSFQVTIEPINDAPTLGAISNVTSNEDCGLITVNLTDIGAGSGESQALMVTASSSNPSLIPNPTVSYTSPSDAGRLTFTPSANTSGSATIRVIVSDDGGTANGGIDQVTNSFLVTIEPINDAPTVGPISDVITNEDCGLITVNLTGITAGPGGESQVLTVRATSSDTNVIPHPTVSYVSPGTTGRLTFAPVTNAYGTATITLVVADNGGTSDGGSDKLTNSFTVTIVPVNDPPTLAPISNLLTNRNAGLLTVNLSGIGAGGGEPQTLTITASSSNPGLIPDPTVNYLSPNPAGTLSFTPVANASGSATITVMVTDDGAPPLIATQRFTVTITTNLPPDVQNDSYAVNEDSTLNGASVLANDSDLHGGELGENNLPLRMLLVTNTANGSLNPNLSTGTFTYTPNPNFFGTNTFAYRAVDSLGGTSAIAVVTITVAPVNDPPTFTLPRTLLTVNESSVPHTEANWATAISAGPNEGAQTVNFTVANNNPGLFSVQPAIAPNGTLTFTPAVHVIGSATNTVVLTDDGTPPLTATQTFVITVRAYNYPPAPVADGATNVVELTNLVEDSGPWNIPIASLLANDSPGSSNETWQTLTLIAATNAVGGSVAIAGTNVVFTPATNFFGTASFRYTVQDDGQSGSPPTNQFLTASAMVSFPVLPVNDPPRLLPPASTNINEGSPWNFALPVADVDTPAQYLTFALLEGPDGLSLNPTNGVLAWTPTEAQGPGTNTVTVVVFDNGSPSLSDTQSLTVVVREVNAPPQWQPPPAGLTAKAHESLIITNIATDPDLPTNSITYSLEAGDLSNVGFRVGTSGEVVVYWTPSAADAGTPKTIRIVAADNGTPPLTSTQVLSIAVEDTLDLAIGSTTMRYGTTGNVSLASYSSTLMTNLTFDLQLPPALLTDLTVAPGSNLTAHSAVNLGNGLWRVSLMAAASGLQGTQALGSLQFRALAGQHSAILPLQPTNLLVTSAFGQPIHVVASAGQVVLLGDEPVLVISPLLSITTSNQEMSVTVHSLPGSVIQLQTATNLTPSPILWRDWQRLTTTNLTTIFLDSPTNPATYYRALTNAP